METCKRCGQKFFFSAAVSSNPCHEPKPELVDESRLAVQEEIERLNKETERINKAIEKLQEIVLVKKPAEPKKKVIVIASCGDCVYATYHSCKLIEQEITNFSTILNDCPLQDAPEESTCFNCSGNGKIIIGGKQEICPECGGDGKEKL